MTELTAVFRDITVLEVDVIVNAANSSLLGGGGVDGAIHRKAGPELIHECRLLGGCKTGQAKITKEYNLPAPFIVHTVGPVWQGGNKNEAELLARCYQNSLSIAADKGCKTIAFPSISCGIYGYPFKQAAEIAVKTTYKFIRTNNSSLESIIFCCFEGHERDEYLRLIDEQHIL